jgi:hypothetical protein
MSLQYEPSKLDKEILELLAENKLYGLTYKEIKNIKDLPKGKLQRSLKFLISWNKIMSINFGIEGMEETKIYFPNYMLYKNEEELLSNKIKTRYNGKLIGLVKRRHQVIVKMREE